MYQVVNVDDEKYPSLLKQIKDAPKNIYYKGNFKEDIFSNCLAVVGSRKISSYGKWVTQKFVTELVSLGITIVSGFMYGVDATAHFAAVKAKGKTIAVMPCGIDLIHPSILGHLYQDILNSNGLIISEYEGKFKPCLWTYPRRNRIIAGLCQAVLVVEAQERSGSLITARYAKKYNRKTFCIPGQINSVNSKGIINLIKEGSTIVGEVSDILDFYQIKYSSIASSKMFDSDNLIIKNLMLEPMDFDTLCEKTGLRNEQLGSELTMLLLSDKIIEQEGKYYTN
ncbi:MAG: DNA protecting protein DprA [Actinobacteria bacterium RBG_19FT_COMBO_36_27]|nr:MAG: DNA protecting protein DprA [Actinobacteria bacterium RBG_19FT_COMBO_36_27]